MSCVSGGAVLVYTKPTTVTPPDPLHIVNVKAHSQAPTVSTVRVRQLQVLTGVPGSHQEQDNNDISVHNM